MSNTISDTRYLCQVLGTTLVQYYIHAAIFIIKLTMSINRNWQFVLIQPNLYSIWRIQHTTLNIPPLLYKFSKNLGATPKFWAPIGWHEESSTPRTQILSTTVPNVVAHDLCTPVKTTLTKKVLCIFIRLLRYPLLHTLWYWRTRSCSTWQSIFCLFVAGLVCLWSPPLFVDVPSFSPELRNMHLFAWFSISAAGYFFSQIGQLIPSSLDDMICVVMSTIKHTPSNNSTVYSYRISQTVKKQLNYSPKTSQK